MPVKSDRSSSGAVAARGEVVLCVTQSGDTERRAECLQRVHTYTPEEVPILICGGRAGDGESPTTITDAIATAAPADIVLVSDDCAVAEGWLDGLRDAAYADSTVATSSPLSIRGEPEAASFEAAAAAIRASSLRIHPRLEAAGARCVYLRRSALELVREFDSEFSRRCLDAGLCHVGADDVLVRLPGLHEGELTGTDPDFESSIGAAGERAAGPRARSLGVARRALGEPSIVIDARVLTGPVSGTQVHVLELIAAIARIGRATVRVLLPLQLSEYGAGVIEALPDVQPITVAEAESHPFRGDVVHRPFQISAPADLSILAQLGDRLVITQQDLIGYHNPSYFSSGEAWEGHRRLTRRALAVADRVLFLSTHARDDAVAEELVERGRTSVIPIGVDHRMASAHPDPAPPAGAESVAGDREAMLCIGADYRHKNRVFALRLTAELQRRHGWNGVLVLAGSRMSYGSSAAEERLLLAADERLREAVIDLGEVSEAEKAWLFGRCALVVYPTLHEGFGLVPFEALHHRVPCLWAPGTSLSEILPDAAAGIVPWDAAASAGRALELMRNEPARAENLEALARSAESLRWDAAADTLLDVYLATCDQPPSPAGSYERREGLMQAGFSEDAVRLVGPEGLLPREAERPLLALASHSRLGRPVFRALATAYRASRRRRPS